MSEKRYHLQGRYRYKRSSFKDNDNEEASDCFGLSSSMESGSSADFHVNCPTCPACPDVFSDHECTSNAKGEIADILHKKCPVIKLVHQQITEVLDQGQMYFSGDSLQARYRRSRAVIAQIRRILDNQGACAAAAMSLVIMLVVGIVLGAGGCGSIRGQPNNPLLSCLASYIGNSRSDEQFYSIY